MDDPGGLSAKEWRRIAALLAIGLGLAGLLLFVVPSWLVSGSDYRCPPPPATGQLTSSCLAPGAAGAVDHRALSEARAGARIPFGVFSAALLAGTAAAVGVIVSSHNARLTHRALTATATANTLTEQRDRATAERERERAADDRYTTAIEQLGHASASVRLGAMHSLHRLAESDGDRLPTVVDVLCAYLRQPFHHPHHDWNPRQHPSDAQPPARAWWPDDQKERDERDSERQVRSTATRLIPTLLPLATPPQASEAPALEINLDGAMLDGLDLSGRRTGRLRLDGAHITGDLQFCGGAHIDSGLRLGEGAHITGNLDLNDGAHIGHDLELRGGAHIDGGIWLGQGTYIDGDLRLNDGAHIGDGVVLDEGAHIDGSLWLGEGARIDSEVRLGAGAYITRSLLLNTSAHIGYGVWLEGGAHIDGSVRLGQAAYIVGGVTLGDAACIGGTLTLTKHAHIDGALHLDEQAYIIGALHVIEGAYITGSLVLSEGAHIDGPVVIGKGAHIDGDLVGAKGSLSEVRRHPEAAMRSSWFASAGVHVVELGDWAASPP